jgi:hypothetical protein
MLTFRNVFALVLFLFGTTFLRLTAAFLGNKQAAATGVVWTVVQVGAILVIVGLIEQEEVLSEPLPVHDASR